MKRNMKRKKGFTLIELVVVIAILAILALILIPTISGYISRADEARDQANLRSIYTAAVLVNETDPLATEESKYSQVKEIANVKETFTINWSADPITVTYEGITFDGVDFSTEEE